MAPAPTPPDPEIAELRRLAIEVAQRARAPYSGLQVGAAGRTDDGRIVTGCNVECVSYGLTLCAECGLVSAMAREDTGPLVQLSCVDAAGNVLMPCGRCRQLLAEYGTADLVVDNGADTVTIGQLLPHAFDADDLPDRQ